MDLSHIDLTHPDNFVEGTPREMPIRFAPER